MDRTLGDAVKCSFCGAASSAEASFCWACGKSLRPDEESLVPAPPSSQDDGDEMRPISALFADIVGSTRLGEHLAPDEVKSLVGECVGRMSRAVEEFGGVVQAYMGDGICAYFGVPVAHGDDAERAARAALRILQAIEEQRRDIEAAWGVPELNVRVGINSGPAAVGLVGGAEPQQVALGDATNIAARLQASADPGTIALGPVTARQLAERFVLEPLGELQFAGREGRVSAWRLVGLRTISATRSTSPFVGREPEVATLTALSDELKAGRGRILLITAAAGMGKTRLLGEFEGAVGREITWLQGQCLPYEGELPYGPFVELLREWLGVGTSEPEISVRTKLRARMRELSSNAAPRWIAFLGRLLCVKVEAELEEQIANLSPEELAIEIRRSYVQWIEALTDLAPVVLALENVHHADAITCSLAEELVSLTDSAPLCVAATMEAKPSSEGWRLRLRLLTEFSHRTTELAVAPLSDNTAIQMVDFLTPAGTLEPELRTEIVGRSEGNPFYLREILRAVLEGGTGARESTWTVSADLPPALESLLMARIDRLPPQARRAAQIAAIIGRDFRYGLLQRAAGGEDLRQDLAVLLRAEIVRELRRYPALDYTFTSSLLHEAVLSTMTPSRLRALNGRVGALLEEDSGTLSEDNPGVLAFYYYRSDHQEKALRYLERAATKADSFNASTHSSELWRRALKAAKRAGDEDSIRRIEATLLRSK
ncbi:MAG TPA: adenylate/guanylate cyclase domain-containing protein [Actinomycetota bacterium]|nr:adenylate/guanylate cyclase domain-containing protein [Actinomycetota bacterium]